MKSTMLVGISSGTSSKSPSVVGDPTDPRIDRVVFQVHDSSLGGVLCDSELMIVEGVPSPAPVAPAEPDNSITLALITVDSTGITDIEDQRRPFVTCGATRVPELVLDNGSAGSGSFVKANWPDAAYFEVVVVGVAVVDERSLGTEVRQHLL